MICFHTPRLEAVSEMVVLNGKLLKKPDEKSDLGILNIQPSTGIESCFVFYDRNRTSTKVCQIAIVTHRERFELEWDTEPLYRCKGYMTEALSAWIEWTSKNTEESELWALIADDNTPSVKTAQKFSFIKADAYDSKSFWYVLRMNQDKKSNT